MRHPPIAPGGVDWADNWRRKVEIRAAHPVGARNWDDRAGRFARMTAELDPDRDPWTRALGAAIRPEDTALDVGAGAGRYALPLARMAAHVTAVEPSEGMRASMAQSLRKREISNVTIVGGTWQEAEVEPHDVVACAHVVYFVRDIVPFIEKLDETARRACYIHLRVDENASRFYELFQDIYGEPYPSEPGFADLLPLLLSLGIRPNVQITTGEGGGFRYGTIEDAVEAAKTQIGAADITEHDPAIRRFLEERLVPQGERLALPGPPQQSAIIWWEKS
jgi:protein-L-isoaspartate O-methyltransferase